MRCCHGNYSGVDGTIQLASVLVGEQAKVFNNTGQAIMPWVPFGPGGNYTYMAAHTALEFN